MLCHFGGGFGNTLCMRSNRLRLGWHQRLQLDLVSLRPGLSVCKQIAKLTSMPALGIFYKFLHHLHFEGQCQTIMLPSRRRSGSEEVGRSRSDVTINGALDIAGFITVEQRLLVGWIGRFMGRI